VRTRLGGLRIPLDQRVGTLSGGQRAQVALALTLAKRPRVLLLDEPLAALDPLARQNFLAALAEAAAVEGDGDGELTIVLSSHLIADIERVCDHLILLADSRVQLCGDIDALLAEHRVLVGPRKDTTAIARAHTIVREDSTARQTTLLVRLNGPVVDPAWVVEETNLEEMVLGYMTQGTAGVGTGPAAGRLSAVGGDR
jgi:ABC-2 type transport system ATP-binding protein